MKTNLEKLKEVNTGQRILDGYARGLADNIEAIDKDMAMVAGSLPPNYHMTNMNLKGIRKGLDIAADIFFEWIGVKPHGLTKTVEDEKEKHMVENYNPKSQENLRQYSSKKKEMGTVKNENEFGDIYEQFIVKMIKKAEERVEEGNFTGAETLVGMAQAVGRIRRALIY
jgi:hypothetical protein